MNSRMPTKSTAPTMISQATAPKARRVARKVKKSKRGGIAPEAQLTPLSKSYHLTSDTLGMHLATTVSIPNDAVATGLVSRVIALWPGAIGAPNYSALGNYFPVLAGLKNSYARFMVTRLKVTATCTSPYTSGGFLACNFEADSTGVSGPPSSLGDVTNANVYAIATPGSPSTYVTDVCLYFNDWKNSTLDAGDPADIIDAGIIQIWGSNSSGTGIGVGLLTIECDFYFAGYRSLS